MTRGSDAGARADPAFAVARGSVNPITVAPTTRNCRTRGRESVNFDFLSMADLLSSTKGLAPSPKEMRMAAIFRYWPQRERAVHRSRKVAAGSRHCMKQPWLATSGRCESTVRKLRKVRPRKTVGRRLCDRNIRQECPCVSADFQPGFTLRKVGLRYPGDWA